MFQETDENKISKIYKPKSYKQIARNNIKLDDKQLNKKLSEKMINPYFFSDRNLKVGIKINLDTHQITHAKGKVTIIPKNSEFGIEVRYIIKIIEELSAFYAKLINQ